MDTGAAAQVRDERSIEIEALSDVELVLVDVAID